MSKNIDSGYFEQKKKLSTAFVKKNLVAFTKIMKRQFNFVSWKAKRGNINALPIYQQLLTATQKGNTNYFEALKVQKFEWSELEFVFIITFIYIVFTFVWWILLPT